MRTITSASIMMLSLLAASASAGQQNTPPAEPDQNTGLSSLAGRPVRLRLPRHGLQRRLGRSAVSALSRPAQRSVPRRVPLGQERRSRILGRPRDARRLPRSAVRRELQQVREAEGVVRVQPDPALLQRGYAHRVLDGQSRRPQARRLPGAGAERRRDDRGVQQRRERLRPSIEAEHHRFPCRLQPDGPPRSERVVQEHAEKRRAAVGGHLRLQRRGRTGGAGRHAHDRCRRSRGVDERPRHGPRRLRRLILQGRRRPRSSGTTRCVPPTRHPPGRRRAG